MYNGQMCHHFVRPEPKTQSWRVALKVEQGSHLGTWMSANAGKPAYARGKISPQGTVEMTLEAFNVKGNPIAGLLTGAWSNNEIKASGAWQNGLEVTAHGAHAP